MQPDKVSDLSRRYPVWLCDIWGVVHDGHVPIASAVAALEQHRQRGGTVVLITNAPRPKPSIVEGLARIGASAAAYDDIVSSGDVCRTLMLQHGQQGIYHLGPEQDLPLFEGLGLARVDLPQAGVVVCTGFFDDRRDTPQTYAPQLQAMLARGLHMICANPDKVVRIGGELLPCAGAIAEAYAAMGGTVLMAGKPFAPIYDEALLRAGAPPRAHVMVIGDGPETDVAGAVAQDLPCLFVTGGINHGPEAEGRARARFPAARILAAMPALEWT